MFYVLYYEAHGKIHKKSHDRAKMQKNKVFDMHKLIFCYFQNKKENRYYEKFECGSEGENG